MKMENKNKISQVVKDNLCTGCGTCYAMCPKEAISMKINERKGIYEPVIDESKCNNCGICYEVCPGHAVDFEQLNLEIFGKEPEDILIGNYLNCYIGYSTDYDIRYNSSSGGLVTQLLIFALEEGIIDGALVTRMKKDKPLEPEPFIARTREEVIEASKTKYCPVPANVALRKVLEANEKERFAVVGLPCHIHGVRKAEQINKILKERIVLHLGLFCLANISFLGTNFIFRQFNINTEDIDRISYRGNGWPGGMKVIFKDGGVRFLRTEEYYNEFFASFKIYRCLLCHDHTNELADISFGDAWHEKDRDNVGLSVVISRNDKAEKFLKTARNKAIKLKEIKVEEIKKSQDYMAFKKRDLNARITLMKFLGKKIPSYNIDLPKSPINAYLNSICSYIDNFLINHNLLKILKWEVRLRTRIISLRNPRGNKS